MKNKCPSCQKEKARRDCALKEHVKICSRCCAELRGLQCGDCPHYLETRRNQMMRSNRKFLPEGDFLIELTPEVEEKVNNALDLGLRGQIEQAMKLLMDLKTAYPKNHLVCFGIGSLHALQGLHSEAIMWFKDAIAIYPYFAEAYFNLGVAYKKDFQICDMIRFFRKAVDYGDPAEPYCQEARSIVCDMEDSIMRDYGLDLDAYLRSEEEFNKAFDLMEQSEWNAALVGFRKAAAIHEQNRSTHGNMALCLANIGRKADALQSIDRALEIDPEYQVAKDNRNLIERLNEGETLAQFEFKSVNSSLKRR